MLRLGFLAWVILRLCFHHITFTTIPLPTGFPYPLATLSQPFPALIIIKDTIVNDITHNNITGDVGSGVTLQSLYYASYTFARTP